MHARSIRDLLKRIAIKTTLLAVNNGHLYISQENHLHSLRQQVYIYAGKFTATTCPPTAEHYYTAVCHVLQLFVTFTSQITQFHTQVN